MTHVSTRTGIISGPEFNHSDFCWSTRLLPGECTFQSSAAPSARLCMLPLPRSPECVLPRDLPRDSSCSHLILSGVSDAFSLIWGGDEDLVVSFDGGNAFRPWKNNQDWKTKGGWWHVDQNSLKGEQRRGRVCVQASQFFPTTRQQCAIFSEFEPQGLVTYTDSSAESGGLCVIPGSHKHHHDLCCRSPSANMLKDFVHVQADDALLLDGGGLVCARAGDLLLWDSRTIHCNTPAIAELDAELQATEAKQLSLELLRVVSYVCMQPRRMATPHQLRCKLLSFAAKCDHQQRSN